MADVFGEEPRLFKSFQATNMGTFQECWGHTDLFLVFTSKNWVSGFCWIRHQLFDRPWCFIFFLRKVMGGCLSSIMVFKNQSHDNGYEQYTLRCHEIIIINHGVWTPINTLIMIKVMKLRCSKASRNPQPLVMLMCKGSRVGSIAGLW